jgi:hypothetical protein
MSAPLRNKYIGPLDVIAVPSAVTVKLALPANVHRSTHDVFHVDRLKKYQPASPDLFPTRVQQQRPPPDIIDGVEMYEVEDILAEKKVLWSHHGKRRSATKYLVKWKGYSSAESTWEPAEALRSASEVVRRYKSRIREEEAEEAEEEEPNDSDSED